MSVPSASFSGASLIGARVGPHGFRVRAGGVGGVGVREGIGGRNRSFGGRRAQRWRRRHRRGGGRCLRLAGLLELRSEEHTSELQSRVDLVCRLLLEKKKKRP